MIFIAPIVEGSGETQALERLIWRIAQAVSTDAILRINQPIRVKSGSFFNDASERGRHVLLAAAKARQFGGQVLILLDCEDDCPAKLGPHLLAQVRATAPDVPFIVALAFREYETWFVAAAESLRGVAGMADDVTAPANPESMRDAKGWLGRHLPHRYDPVTHQLAFTKHFDLQTARRIPSFDRLYRKIEALVTHPSH
ncbi:DUF4276 family protein [Pseudorhodoferax sp.]|uniref:DUF4276 family protein n=1 Tax=Pseudorhodoferax sp. TaxID=1993553 RepID=UPI002DD65149|nr:DUF4276 family protein [Pseudorhodoferax sp.]